MESIICTYNLEELQSSVSVQSLSSALFILRDVQQCMHSLIHHIVIIESSDNYNTAGRTQITQFYTHTYTHKTVLTRSSSAEVPGMRANTHNEVLHTMWRQSVF